MMPLGFLRDSLVEVGLGGCYLVMAVFFLSDLCLIEPVNVVRI